MDSSKDKGRNELTPEQKAKVRPATEKDAKAVELSAEELEERIAPRAIYQLGGLVLAGGAGLTERVGVICGRFRTRFEVDQFFTLVPGAATNLRRVPWTAPRARSASS
jgi:hypothetical protein